MATSGVRINDLLKFNPDWVKDPVPPWLFEVLDKNILRDLAIVSLEHSRNVQELNIKSIDRAMEVIRKAKL